MSESDVLQETLSGLLSRMNQMQSNLVDLRREVEAAVTKLPKAQETPVPSEAAKGAHIKVDEVNRALRRLSTGNSQERILEIFLEESQAYAERAILFLHQSDQYVTWKSYGFDPDKIQDIVLTDSNEAIVRAAEHRQLIYRGDQPAESLSWLRDAGDLPTSTICIPFVFDNTVPVVFYGDSGSSIEIDYLELITHLSVLVLKNNYLRELVADGRAETASTPSDMPAAEPVLEAPAVEESDDFAPGPDQIEKEMADAGDEVSLETEPVDESASLVDDEVSDTEALDALEAEIEAEPVSSFEGVEEGSVEAEEELAAAEEEIEPQRWSPTVVDEEDFADLSMEPSAEEVSVKEPAEPAFSDAAVEEEPEARTPDEPEVIEPAAAEEPAVEEAPPPVPEAEEPEVEESLAPVPDDAQPTSDEPVLGSDEEETAHEEARRFARLLVSEIKLYNEGEVEEGRQSGDLYQRLRRDLDRSRDMYMKRVHPAVQGSADYFHDEVVRILAKGDSALLGEGYPGSN